MTCIVCGAPVLPGSSFCVVHSQASSGQRGGWLSSHRRKLAVSDHGASPLDADQVFRKLYVGSKPPIDRRLPAFSLVILAAREYQPEKVSWQGRVVRARLDDAEPTEKEIVQAVLAAREVADELHRGGRVLVTCYAGRNRSALIAALAMLISKPKATPNAVISAIRKRRDPSALSNPHFTALLRRLFSLRQSTQ